ncbi:hypothetical protein K435DRAFT_881037 [Dendrothele bispora CBS 962.96]|uniref:Uncharacterized protein n=1 Tax=Dendrothele bispora (strain CBS 962.96) TaxID=1314807 RepID=A0A4S8KIS6_DENBC|nr:hypothetical protein K435DRAFT_881037 [Dendrothele bispora CBS 962.96]
MSSGTAFRPPPNHRDDGALSPFSHRPPVTPDWLHYNCQLRPCSETQVGPLNFGGI